MMLLFEGCDKSGKSTLLRNFVSASNTEFRYWKNDVLKPSTFHVSDFILGLYAGVYSSLRSTDAVIDRSHITEIVYGQAIRSYKVGERFKDVIDNEIFGRAIVVYVDTPIEIIFDRLTKLGDDYIDKTAVAAIRQSYEEYFETCRLPVIRIDGSKDQDECLSQLIHEYGHLRKAFNR